MTKAIIVGSQGQDGRLLFDLLSSKAYECVGISRGKTDVHNSAAVADLVQQTRPDEIYYLAAVHHSSQQNPDAHPAQLFHDSFNINVAGLLNFLEAMRLHAPAARLFYAASSHVFGSPPHSPQNELTPLNPACVYGITKTAGIQCCRFYRKKHAVFAACGILYNHESIHRRPEFVTRKIIDSAIRISRGRQDHLVLGDLSAKVDWGYAPDYVAAMHKILQIQQADDFVIATGVPHSVQEFVETAFAAVNLDWHKYVTEEKSLVGKSRTGLVGDSSHLRQSTGWSPSLDFNTMVRRLVEDILRTPDANNHE